MNGFTGRLLCGAIGALLLSGACAGKRLNDVGDVNGGAGGDDASGGKLTGQPPGQGGEGGDALVSSLAGEGGGGSGGKGNTGGNGGRGGGDVIGISGEGGEGGVGVDFECPNCELLLQTPDIRGIFTANERVYWIEYGSFDDLGNYEDNGRLLARPVEGGDTELIHEGLHGPIQVGASANFAYVVEERSGAPAGSIELTRISLDSGEQEIVQALPASLDLGKSRVDWFQRFFVVANDIAYWVNQGVVYRLSELTPGTPETLYEPEQTLITLLTDGTRLLLHDATGVDALSFSGGSPTPVWTSATSANFDVVSVAGGFLYGIEYGAQSYFAGLDPSNASYKRVGKTFSPWIQRLRFNGSRYVMSGLDLSRRPTIGDGLMTNPNQHRAIAQAPTWTDGNGSSQRSWRAWDATDTQLFLGYGDELYRFDLGITED